MIGELLNVTTCDGLRLDGILHRCEDNGSSDSPDSSGRTKLDAAICLHGAASNFYASTLVARIAEPLLKAGVAVLRVNTRGHDLAYYAKTEEGAKRLGAAYENVEHSSRDIDAWTDLLLQRGYQRIALIGHSLGAIKALAMQATAIQTTVPRDEIACVVAASPPRLSYAFFRETERGPEFFETFQRAKQLIEQGDGEQLLEVSFPIPLLITATGFVEKYGPDERLNFLRFLDDVQTPTLFTFGSLELQQSELFAGLPEVITALGSTKLEVVEIAGANHFYSGVELDLAAKLCAYLARTCPSK